MIRIDHLDHLVLTVQDIEATCHFYSHVLGMSVVEFADGRKALHFGGQKINLHNADSRFYPRAQNPTEGSADLCFITQTPLDDVIKTLIDLHVPIVAGPIDKIGALGPIRSVYIRDPDNNLLELSNTLF